VPPSESASPSCCRQNRAVIRAAVGDFLATLGARPPGRANSTRKLVRHCRAHAGFGVGTAGFGQFSYSMRPVSGTAPAFAAIWPANPIRPVTVVPRPGVESTWQEPPSAVSRSLMLRSPDAATAAGSKPGPLSVTSNCGPSPGVGQANPHRRSRRVPGGVVQGFHAAEVDGGFYLGRVPVDTVGADLDLPGCLAGLGADGGGQALVGEQRRVDAAGESAQGLQRAAGLGPELRDQCPSRSVSWPTTDSARASVEATVSSCCWAPSWMSRSIRRRWSSAALTIPSREACRSASLARSCWVRQQQAGLGRQVGHEPVLDRREVLPRPLGHRQHA
jgi:hypothetical protein